MDNKANPKLASISLPDLQLLENCAQKAIHATQKELVKKSSKAQKKLLIQL